MAKKYDLNKMGCAPNGAGAGNAIYGLGFLGALIYYLTTSTDIWMALLGIVKAVFWPAVLVYGALKQFGL